MPRTQVRRDAVKSVSKIEANRRNARASTGPRTVAGKARAAQNARRHGLSLPARYDPSRSGGIVTLARAIAGTDAGAERFEIAFPVAAAQIDVERARQSAPRPLSAGTARARRDRPARGHRPLRRATRCRCASAPCATSTMRRRSSFYWARRQAFRRNEATGRRCAGWWATAASAAPACPSSSPQGRSTRGMARRLQ